MNEKFIWDFLYKEIKNSYGVAALMGNLFAESSFNPLCANNVKKKTGMTNEQYTAAVNDNKYTNFVSDSIAYGIAQWCYKTRKQALLSWAKAHNKSIGDLQTQLEFLLNELKSYKTAYQAVINAKDVKTASDIVMLKYEKPANTSESAKAKRANYGQKYYDMFANDKIKIVISLDVAKSLLEGFE